jgi:hypothetical protein
MRRWLISSGAILAVAGAVALAVMALPAGGPPSYERLRQARVQEIPGTLGYVLEPPPDDFEPLITPGRALRLGADQYVDREDLRMTLAIVRDVVAGGPPMGTAWVIVNRHVCLRSAKGDLVSDARGNDPNDLGCTNENMWIVAVEADSGKLLMSESAFDPTSRWAPLTEIPDLTPYDRA